MLGTCAPQAKNWGFWNYQKKSFWRCWQPKMVFWQLTAGFWQKKLNFLGLKHDFFSIFNPLRFEPFYFWNFCQKFFSKLPTLPRKGCLYTQKVSWQNWGSKKSTFGRFVGQVGAHVPSVGGSPRFFETIKFRSTVKYSIKQAFLIQFGIISTPEINYGHNLLQVWNLLLLSWLWKVYFCFWFDQPKVSICHQWWS